MIKIDTSNSKRWDKIKDNHKLYFKEVITPLYLKCATSSDVYSKFIYTLLPNATFDTLCLIEFDDMKKLIKKFSKSYKSSFGISPEKIKFRSKDSEQKEYIYDFKQVTDKMKEIFNYTNFVTGAALSNKEVWNRHALISSMEIMVCPYCNRNYISNLRVSGKKNTTADLDHYFLKSMYPFLSLSLYNFIPSCQICNSRFKLNKNFYVKPHIYPYKEDFAIYNVTFKTKPENNDISYLKGTSTHFRIDIENPLGESNVNSSIDTFKLRELYQIHKPIVKEIILKKNIYNDTLIKELAEQFNDLFKDEEELRELIFSNYPEVLCNPKRSLSKLTKDICDELDEYLKTI